MLVSMSHSLNRMDSSLDSKNSDNRSIFSVSNVNLQEGLMQNEDEERILQGSTDGDSSPQPSPRTLHQWCSAIKELIVDQWFLVALGGLVLISSQVQVPQPQQGVGLQNVLSPHRLRI